ncbi:MAG: restriction endonuclease subunit S [Geobacter sp.]|nr:restriction endonuclease subunit S [Geobacter sp.]
MSWSSRPLEECATFLSGGTPNKMCREYWDGDIPWVSSAELTSRFIDDTKLHISADGLKSGSRLMPAGSIFAVVRGMSLATEFRIALSQRPMAFNQDVKAIIPKPGIDGTYLFYALSGRAHEIRDLATEAAHGTKKLEMSRLQNFQIAVPDFDIQKKVAAVGLAYDDLIVANQRRIKLLEESARLLYREWFVLLRFPGHEPVPVTNGVPEGWERKPVSEMIDANPKTPFPKDISRPFVGMEALSEDSMIIDVSDARPVSGGAKFRNGDTLLARITPCLENGKTGFVQFLEDDEAAASGSTEFIVLRSRTVNRYWIYCLARSDSFREHAINSMAGSDGRQRVNSKCFDKYLTLQPPSDVLQVFEENVSGVFAQVQSLTEYNRALRQARDMLLPKLMSGAMDVSRIAVPKEVEV